VLLILKRSACNLISLQKGEDCALEVFVRGVYFVLLTLIKQAQEEDLLSKACCPPAFTGFTAVFSLVRFLNLELLPLCN